jgi:glycosyltransferase involved in cell wall biosynthesis
MPTVSVIIPAYNSSPYIEDALESVFAQTFTDYEIIVVNDGSPDASELERVLAPYRDRIVYIQQENEGTAGARNTAIRVAQGRYIALLDPDDLWMPEYLRVQIEILERDSTIDVLYPDAVIFGDGQHVGKRFMEVAPSEGKVTFESLVELRCKVYIGVTAKRDILLRAGLFDPDRSVIEDFDLWLRVIKVGGRIAYHREVLARYRERADAQSADLVRMGERQMNALDKALSTLDLSSSERNAAEKTRALFWGSMQLNLTKRAFLCGDFDSAVRHLHEANAYFRRPKLALAGWIMRFAPHLLLRAYNMREKSPVAASTRS